MFIYGCSRELSEAPKGELGEEGIEKMSGVPDFTTFGGVMFWVGIIIAIVGGILFLALWRQRAVAKFAGIATIVGVVIAVFGVAAINLAPAPSAVAPNVPGSSANAVVKS